MCVRATCAIVLTVVYCCYFLQCYYSVMSLLLGKVCYAADCRTVSLLCIFFCFFFQAEDGIRDYKVTGVQTCALPISDNLTARLRGSETMYVQVDVAGADATSATGALGRIAGVTRVVESDRRDRSVGFEVESESGRDVRRDLAKTIVTNGWGLLELRPMRMSLEEVFLSLTTEDVASAPAPTAETNLTPAGDAVNG